MPNPFGLMLHVVDDSPRTWLSFDYFWHYCFGWGEDVNIQIRECFKFGGLRLGRSLSRYFEQT